MGTNFQELPLLVAFESKLNWGGCQINVPSNAIAILAF